MELETAFYAIAIVYMAVMFIVLLIMLAAILVIKAKVEKAHDAIEAKLFKAKNVAKSASIGQNTLRYFLRNK